MVPRTTECTRVACGEGGRRKVVNEMNVNVEMRMIESRVMRRIFKKRNEHQKKSSFFLYAAEEDKDG